jgi:hypothetical protein
MKNRMSRKLKLNRETLRYLNDASLSNVGGGATEPHCIDTVTCDTCWHSCLDTQCVCSADC